MASKGGLQADTLFLGLTRPVTILGVHYIMVLLNFFGCGMLFINLDNSNKLWQTPLLFALIHALLYVVCLKEVRMIDIAMQRFGKFSKVKNKNRKFYGNTNSYDLT